MNPFKPGDQIVCTNPRDREHQLHQGGTYTAINDFLTDDLVMVEDDNGHQDDFFVSRFVLANHRPTPRTIRSTWEPT